jgi:hypothetical protein
MFTLTPARHTLAAIMAAGLLAGCAQMGPQNTAMTDAMKSHAGMDCCKEKMGADGKPMPCKCCGQKAMAGALGAAPQSCMDQMSKKAGS